MPKCCITTCISGTFKDDKQRKAAGQKGAAFFSFPKDETLLALWKERLYNDVNKVVESNDKVCELHFHEMDITMYDETILKDGSVHRVQRKRYQLNPLAIPLTYIRKRKLEEEVPVENKNAKVIWRCSSENLQQKDKKLLREEKKILLKNISEALKKTYPAPQEKPNIKINKANDVASIEPSKNLKEVQVETETFDKAFDEAYESNEAIDTKEKKHAKINFLNVSSKMNFSTKKTDTKSGGTESCNKNYSFADLKIDLKTKNFNISSAWAHVSEDDSVTFIYIHPLKLVLQCFCIIDSNMNIKIATSDKRVVKDVSIEIKTKKDFIDFLEKLQRMIYCDGTGFEDKYSPDCLGFLVSESDFVNLKGFNKCNPCRLIKKQVLKNKSDQIYLELQLHQQNRLIEDLKFKCDQLQEMLEDKTFNKKFGS